MIIQSGNIIKIAHTYSPTFGYDFIELLTDVRRELAWWCPIAETQAALINFMPYTACKTLWASSSW